MVKWVSGFVHAGSVSMPPENTSWKISTKGMIVMAAVVVRARVLTHSDIMSDAKVIRNIEMPKSTRNSGVTSPAAGYFTPTAIVTYSVTTVCARHSSAWYSMCANMYEEMCMPERCSRLITSRSRQITWIELKHPFQMATHTMANAPISVPSMLRKNFLRTTMPTRPAISAAIGSTFQSLWYTNMRISLPK